MSKTRIIFSDNLKELTHGASISKIARSAGISRQTMYKYFHGEIPRPEILEKLAEILCCEVYDLFRPLAKSSTRIVELETKLEKQAQEIAELKEKLKAYQAIHKTSSASNSNEIERIKANINNSETDHGLVCNL
jgi:AcrR family transcriptional regulator